MHIPLFHPDSETPAPARLTGAEFRAAFPGEGAMIEFKVGVSGRRIREAVVAFSNSEGGVVLIGVDDSGTVIGVSGPGQAERQIYDALAGLHNPGRFDTTLTQVDGRTLLVLAVARRREGFSQMHDGAVLIRHGARNDTLIGPELTRFQREHSFENFEDAPTPAHLDDADPALIDRAADAYDFESDDTARALREQGLVELSGGRAVLTVMGALILLADPGAVLGRCGIEVLRYRDGESEPDKRVSIGGPVDQLVRRTTAAVMDELGEQSVLVGIERVDLPRLPEVAVRETVANAVAHRSYEAKGTYTRVEIRSDGVTVISPGTLPEPVTVEHIRSQQAARNPKLLAFLRRQGLAEDLGLGIDRVEDAMQVDMLEPPKFLATPHSVTAILPTRALVTAEERGWVKVLMQDRLISADQALVALQAARDGKVTNASVRKTLGIDSTEARVVLQHLCNEGVLVQEGEHGGAQYVPAPRPEQNKSVSVRSDEAERVTSLACEREITNADVRELLGVSRSKALQLLTWLVDRGTLERSGNARGATYRPAKR